MLNNVRYMQGYKITVSGVKEVFRELGEVLGLEEECQESSLVTFINNFSKMEVHQASTIVQDIIASEGYIVGSAQSKLKDMAPRFPHRSKEDVEEKLMRVESIRVAVAILILIKNSSKKRIEWLLEPLTEYINESDLGVLEVRLEAVIHYIEERLTR